MQQPSSEPRRHFDLWHAQLQRFLQPIALGCLRLNIWCYVLACVALIGPSSAVGQQVERDAELAYAKGIVAYGERNYVEALDYFRQAVALTPDNPDAQFYLGLSLTRVGEFEAAIAALQQALQLDPSKRYVHYHLGLAYFHAGRYQDALPHFEQALDVDANKAATYFYLGYSHYQLKQYQQALPFFEQAMAKASDLVPAAQYYRGLTLHALQRDAQAQAAFEAAIAAAPSSTIGVNARRHLETLAQRTRERRLLQVQGVVSFQYDDNVTIGDDDIISREGDGRVVFAFVGRVLPVRTGRWRLGAEYDLFQTLHFDLSEFDIQSHTGKVFARLKLDRVMLRMETDYTYTTLDNNRFSEAVTLHPSVTLRQTDRLFTVASVRYRISNYFNQFIEPGEEDVRDRDGWSVSPELAQYWTFNQNRSYVRLGYNFEASRNDGTDWEYNSHRIAVGLYTPLAWGITLDLEGAYRRRNYLHVNSFDTDPLGVLTATDQDKRTDNRFTTSVVLTREFGQYVILSAGYAHTSNLSNIDFFQYNRNIWTVALTGRY